MYKVLIADDDLYIRKGMYEIINWEEYGFCIAGDVADGKEALDFIIEKSPHLIIADIDMPAINGLELIRFLNSYKIDIKTIFLTGYREFEYVKEAINNRAKGYLTKPIDENELINRLREVKLELLNEKRLEEGISALKEKFFRTLISSQMEYDDLFSGIYDESFGLDENSIYNVILIEIENENGVVPSEVRPDKSVFKNKIKATIEDIERKYNVGFILEDNSHYCIIARIDSLEFNRESLSGFLEEVGSSIKSIAPVTVSFGIGINVQGINNIYSSYCEAIKSLNSMFISGKGNIAYHDSAAARSVIYDFENRSIVDGILKSIDDFNIEKANMGINNLFNGFMSENISISIVKDIIIEIIIQMNKNIRKMHGEISLAFSEKFGVYEKLNRSFSVFELEDWLNSIVSSYFSYIKKLGNERPNELVERIIDYTKINYVNNLSLKSISKEYYMNSSYLGQLFKKTTGESFNDHLARIRIENAKRLLITTDLKVYEISEKVGYNDVQYFYKIYKKITGVHPTSLRAKSI